MARNPGVDWAPWTTSSTAAPTRPARTTATSPAWPAARRPAGRRARRHHQPPVRFGHGRHRHGRPRHPRRRRRTDDRRRRREHEPRALRHGQGRCRLLAQHAQIFDTTIGWRFVNPLMKAQYGIDSMPETAENVAAEFKIARADQDAFALRSQQRAVAAQAAGRFKGEIVPVDASPRRRGPKTSSSTPTSIRAPTRWNSLAKLKGPSVRERHRDRRQRLGRQRRRLRADHRLGRRRAARPDAARAHRRHGRAGVPPRIMGIGPAPATQQAAGPHSA
jgi:hypothetical protein